MNVLGAETFHLLVVLSAHLKLFTMKGKETSSLVDGGCGWLA
jgi:hypothetical protein